MTMDAQQLQSLLASAANAHREWWARDDDEENLGALVALHDLSRKTAQSPNVDLEATDTVIEAGITLLRSDDPVERVFGIKLIREMDHREQEVGRELLALLRRETDDAVIRWCVSGLNYRGSADAIPDLVALIHHTDPKMRYGVAGALSSCAVPSMPTPALDALLELADDDVADVRFSALFELSAWWQDEELHFRDARVAARLESGLHDDDEGVRHTCAEALDKAD